MKKVIAILLTLALVIVAFAACGGSTTTDTTTAADDTTAAADDTTAAETVADLDYIKEKGTLVVGITNFAPMDYQEKGSEEWIGFDADMAKKFAEKLGVKVEFSEIAWENKVLELDSKNIDCVWNGMTLDDEVKAAMSCSKAYCNNAQVIVVPADKAEQYATAEACKELSFAVENGSAGKKQAEANGFKFTEVVDQATAVQEVAAGTSDAAIIDSLMACAMVGEGTGFEQLTYTASLNSEEYGVGFRTGSDLVDAFNTFLDEAIADGTAQAIAEQYGVQAALIK
ncbi:MAG: transporter substrate-binding domain-containing protein [Clostridia bacterium]|nr:transporter substrate-binding domain-containing protein [Clostridia bacterium]